MCTNIMKGLHVRTYVCGRGVLMEYGVLGIVIYPV